MGRLNGQPINLVLGVIMVIVTTLSGVVTITIMTPITPSGQKLFVENYRSLYLSSRTLPHYSTSLSLSQADLP
jgi:hypothetical protein